MVSFGRYIGYDQSPDNAAVNFAYPYAGGMLSLSDTSEHPYNQFSFSVFSSTSNNSNSINYPGSLRAGDIAVLMVGQGNSSSTVPTYLLPTGWTLGTSVGGTTSAGGTTSQRASIFYKALDGTESGSISAGTSNLTRTILTIFRPTGTVRAVTVTADGEYTTTGSSRSHTFTDSSRATKISLIQIYGTPTYSETPSTTTDTSTSSSSNQIGKYLISNNNVNFSYTISGYTRTTLTFLFY